MNLRGAESCNLCQIFDERVAVVRQSWRTRVLKTSDKSSAKPSKLKSNKEQRNSHLVRRIGNCNGAYSSKRSSSRAGIVLRASILSRLGSRL